MNRSLNLDQAIPPSQAEKGVDYRKHWGSTRPSDGQDTLSKRDSVEALFWNEDKVRATHEVHQIQGSGEHEKNTVESITAAYDFIEESHRERLEEGFAVKKMFLEMDRKVEEGSQWYLVPQSWLKQWERYCFFDLIMAAPGSAEGATPDGTDRRKPSKIDYSSIIEQNAGSEQVWLKEVSAKYAWQNSQLKENLQEGEDFMLVTSPIIEFFDEKY